MSSARAPRLYLVTDRNAGTGRDLVETVEAAIGGGVDAVQLREKDLATRSLVELGRALQAVCARHDVPLLVNDRADVALVIDAAGIHLPASSYSVSDARQLLGPDKTVAVSTHSAAEVRQAATAGADFAVFGPVFATPSKTAFGHPQGLDKLREAASAGLPVVGIGGITAATAASVRQQGACGIAAIRALIEAPDPASAAHQLLAGA